MSSPDPRSPAMSGSPAARLRSVLSDAALQLMTASGDAARQLDDVRGLLTPLASADETPAAARQALTAALELLDRAAAGTLPHDSAVARAGTLLDMAMSSAPDEAPAAEEPSAPQFSLPEDTLRELMPEFIAEAHDHLEQVERAILRLEADDSDRDAINVVFRAFHTIKGTAGFFGLEQIVALAHAAESMLCQLREGGVQATPDRTELILQCVDVTRELLAQAQAGGARSPAIASTAYVQLLQRLGGGSSAGHPAAVRTAAGPAAPVQPEVAGATADRRETRADAIYGEATLRVRTERLDRLIDLIGELVVAHTMVAQDDIVHRHRHEALAGRVAHAGKIVRELRELGTSLRMVPLRPLFQKMQRLVRELGRTTGKHVELVTAGADTEIDRNMVDFLADPLVHMIRNAIDHGVELPAERLAAGKPATGVLRLSAWHAGGDVIIELQDDGRGLDTDTIFRRAVEKGLVEADRVLSPSEIWHLTFAPGLSTASAVTALSGRGVGMDVVRRNIEALRGRVDITSAAGTGTTFRLRLPLSLAITDGMLVRVGQERYIVPTSDIQTCFRPAPGTLTRVAGAGELVTWQGTTMPVVHLHRMFGTAAAVSEPTHGVLVVLNVGPDRCALLVDELLGQQQFVARPVDEGLGGVAGVAGMAILSDGRVGLILDTGNIAADRGPPEPAAAPRHIASSSRANVAATPAQS